MVAVVIVVVVVITVLTERVDLLTEELLERRGLLSSGLVVSLPLLIVAVWGEKEEQYSKYS